MDTMPPLPPMSDLHHELQRHAAGLRDLARDLLRDGHAAEDVTQATLHRALAQRDLEPGPLGGWLYRTVVNFAHQWRRSERRRTARENALPAPAAVPAVAEQLARREMLQRVTDAVLRLDEPYQTAIFLRYFEDLPPRTIARRTTTNLATVKSRLARGLAMLRLRLDRADDDRGRGWRNGHDDRGRGWRGALAITFGLPMLGSVWPIPTGTLIVSTTTKAMIVVGAICVGGLLVLQLRDDPALPQPNAAGALDKAAVHAASTTLETPDAPTTRTAPPAIAAEAPWLDHPYEVGIDVLVVDSLGLPIEGHTLELSPLGCAKNTAPQATGPDGRVSVTWRARVPTIEVQLVDPRGQTRRITLTSGHRTMIALLGRRQQGPTLAFYLASTARVASRRATIALDRTGASSETHAVRLLNATNTSSVDLHMHAGLHPAAVFGDPLAQLPAVDETNVAFTMALDGMRFEFADGNVVLGEKVVTRSLKADAPAEGASIEGTVFGADGKTAAKVPVALFGSGPQPLQRGEADEQGRFRFANVVPGDLRVRAGGDQQGIASMPVVVTTGTTPCTLNLQRGACVRGRATTDAGKPRGEHTVEWRALDGSWCDATRTAADGTFTFANLPPGPGSLFLFAREGNRSIPIATVPSILPDTGEALLAAPDNKGSVLRLEPPSPHDGQAAAAVVLWHADTSLAISLQAPDQGTVWSSPKLPAGFYDVELRMSGAGSKRLGRQWLDGEHDVDLGRVEAPRGGSLRIAIPAANLPAKEQQAIEVASLRPDLDVRIEPAQLPLDQPIQLPAGDYVLAYRHADGGVRFHRFTVVADKETVVAPAQ
jgi:RNA polymerase sigma-70 factor (ECF subfamily)